MNQNNKSKFTAVNERLFGNRRTTSRNFNLILLESKERLEFALDALVNGALKCAVYYAYTSMVMSAKAFLLSKNIYRHTHLGVVNGFNTYFFETNDTLNREVFDNNLQFDLEQTISMTIAQYYVSKALTFNSQIKALKH